MAKESNARFLGIVITEPLRIVGHYKADSPHDPLEILEGETLHEMEQRSVREANEFIAKVTGRPRDKDTPMDWEAWEAANNLKL